MAQVQLQFDQFNARIKLKRFEDNKTLREKRDIIREKLKSKLPDVFAEHNETCPLFEFANQGSYEMGTGIKPKQGDFDIDQGLYFAVGTDSYPDPVVLKKRVHEALDGHTKDVQIRRSCVTVFYQRDDEPIYHVDVAVYVDGSEESDGKSRLAKGKEGSADEYRFWEVSSPQELAETIRGRFYSENDRSQFRRTVRYLKRWRDHKFNDGGNSVPSGIGLTVAVSNRLQPHYSDAFTGTPNDLAALESLVNAILADWTTVWDDETQSPVERLVVTLPIEPWGDLFEHMSNTQMSTFKQKLESLRDSLRYANGIDDRVEACRELKRQFGDDFPVPDPEDTSKKHAPAIVSSSNSA